MDFTLRIYRELIKSLIQEGISFQRYEDFQKTPEARVVVLRHDVDKLPGNALEMADLEVILGVKSTYYFRSVKESFNKEIINKIAGMGHEIGYHYENFAVVAKRNRRWAIGKRKGGRGKRERSSTYHLPLTTHPQIFQDAIADFKENLERFRKICPIKTICMHGKSYFKI